MNNPSPLDSLQQELKRLNQVLPNAEVFLELTVNSDSLDKESYHLSKTRPKTRSYEQALLPSIRFTQGDLSEESLKLFLSFAHQHVSDMRKRRDHLTEVLDSVNSLLTY